MTTTTAFCERPDGCDHQPIERKSFGQATSDAEWHNAMTGHDVYVIQDDPDNHATEMWQLTDEGWVN